MTKKVQTKHQQRRKFFLILPLFVIPGLFIAFYALGGGKGGQQQGPDKGPGMGFNMELPPPIFDKKEEKMDKMAFYTKAEQDSVRRRELQQQDPYHRHEHTPVPLVPMKPVTDTQADALLRRLDRLKQRLDEPLPAKAVIHKEIPAHAVVHEEMTALPARPLRDTAVTDPELDRLNEMLDKIARLQKSEQEEPTTQVGQQEMGAGARVIHQGLEASVGKQEPTTQTVALAIPAMVERDQGLVNGATIALRLTSGVRYNGITIRQGQLVYGTVNFSNDRMQVSIRSIRCGQAILTTEWQVYDMDGLPGIFIPDGLGRQAARQSADQTIGGLNLSAYEPSIGAQVTNAGIQTARNFFSRKVRTVRVTVPAGYQVLLRDTKMSASSVEVIPDSVTGPIKVSAQDSVKMSGVPVIDSLVTFLHKSVSEGEVTLTLNGIYQRDGLLWLYLTVQNKGAFPFKPGYIQASIGQGRHIKRMATQEKPLELLYDCLPSIVAGGEEQPILVAIKPFLLSKDKRLLIQIGGEGYGAELLLRIKPHFLSKLYTYRDTYQKADFSLNTGVYK